MGHRAVALLMAAQHDGKKRQEEREKKSCLGIDMPRSQPATSNISRTEDQQNPDAKRPLIERPFLIWSV
ncbi:hypothetical protein CE456_23090 [Aeromonas salmonicida]|nr:hypothetical protein CE456_23090 [Aeromonas salmonicida]ASI29411.1 hypothetical protein CE463_23085 [Aeromonas salmonicida]ASI33542.1 hypothetical protein CE462_22035 [Aeromonas salmonicida]ATD37409.1 hypothetical protein BHG40_05245 [Aeromonas salmonicida subsp. masoucida]